MTPKPALENTLSALAFALAVAGLISLILLHHLFARNPLLIGVQAGAVLIMVWARITFGKRSFHATATTTEGGLVTTGPYRFWRHPIYVSIIYFAWAAQIESPAVLAIGSAAGVTLALTARMIFEERFLRAAYPEYADFCKKSKRFIPFLV